jgi:hypothetical protein
MTLKGQCHEIFCFWFFWWISFIPAPEYSIKTVRIFSKIREIFAAQGLPPVSTTQVANEKSSIRNFNNFVWLPLGSKGNIYINFWFKFTFRCQQPDIVPIICHRRRWHWRQINTRGTGGNICPRCRWYRRQFATGVVDTGGNLPPVSLTPVVNFQPVLLTPGANVATSSPCWFAARINDASGK